MVCSPLKSPFHLGSWAGKIYIWWTFYFCRAKKSFNFVARFIQVNLNTRRKLNFVCKIEIGGWGFNSNYKTIFPSILNELLIWVNQIGITWMRDVFIPVIVRILGLSRSLQYTFQHLFPQKVHCWGVAPDWKLYRFDMVQTCTYFQKCIFFFNGASFKSVFSKVWKSVYNWKEYFSKEHFPKKLYIYISYRVFFNKILWHWRSCAPSSEKHPNQTVWASWFIWWENETLMVQGTLESLRFRLRGFLIFRFMLLKPIQYLSNHILSNVCPSFDKIFINC